MSHAGYILAAFGIAAGVVLVMIGLIMADHRALKRELARFADRGGEGEA